MSAACLCTYGYSQLFRLSYTSQMNAEQAALLDRFAQGYQYGRGVAHARKVADLSASLFDQLNEYRLLESMSGNDRRILYAAGITHDVGAAQQAQEDAGTLPVWAASTGRSNNGVVSFLLLKRLLDNPPGPLVRAPLSAETRSTLLYSVLWSDLGSQLEVPEEPLPAPKHTRQLASILRIAQCLDYSLRGLVSGIQVIKADYWVRILVRSMGSVEQEVAEAAVHARVLEESLRTRVFVQEVIEEDEA